MNQTLQELHARKSIRAFQDRPVSAADKAAILAAACAAPTAGCQQLYTVLDITDPTLKAQLADSCDHQPFIATAPVVLIFCADCKKWYDGFLEAGCAPRRPGVGDLLLAVSDTNIAAQNAVTAAHSLGLASCYIGDIMEQCETQRSLLHLPKYVFPAAMLVIGYPKDWDTPQKPDRVAMTHIVHENGYRPMDGAELRAMWAERAGEQGYDAFMDAFCRRKYNSDFSREMTRSVAAYLKDFEQNNDM